MTRSLLMQLKRGGEKKKDVLTSKEVPAPKLNCASSCTQFRSRILLGYWIIAEVLRLFVSWQPNPQKITKNQFYCNHRLWLEGLKSWCACAHACACARVRICVSLFDSAVLLVPALPGQTPFFWAGSVRPQAWRVAGNWGEMGGIKTNMRGKTILE